MQNIVGRLIRVAAAFTAGAVLIVFSQQPSAQETWVDPIAYVGHGAMFDQRGREVAPTPEFLADVQASYIKHLTSKLDDGQRARFAKTNDDMARGLKLDAQSQLLVNSGLIDWLTNEVKDGDSAHIRGRNMLIKHQLKDRLPDKPDIFAPRNADPFPYEPELLKRLGENELKVAPGVLSLTGNSGAAYRAECLANGVPVPPDFGPGSAWLPRSLPGNPEGIIPRSELFIARNMDAQVLTFQSASPEGMCVALPRFDSANIVRLDGVICVGKASSKACFWDNEKNGTVFTFPRGASRPFADFGGGTELVGGVGGFCTDCHAGENPYIIHGNVLDSLRSAGLPTVPDAWYDPIVRTGDTQPWPENPGPMNSPPSCVGCHGSFAARGFAGRLPHLSVNLPGYCNQVLRRAIGTNPPVPTDPPPAMPPFAPGTLAGTPEMNALLAWCGQPPAADGSNRGDPHLTTINGVNYDFQSGGEFIHLRNPGGIEIQMRQTPVATAAPAFNPHTGLQSCVSVNTAFAARMGKNRVTYQPGEKTSKEQGLELRIDGELVKQGEEKIGLGDGGTITRTENGSGLDMRFADGTRMIVTSNWWDSQQVWYLNADILNTPAREGVMGSIAAGGWLPALPDGAPMGPRPASLSDRHIDLHHKFADAWRVSDATSLFDYRPGTSTADFTNSDWPPEKPPCEIKGSSLPVAEPMKEEQAKEICGKIQDKVMNAQCIFDVAATGEPGFAEAYLATQRLRK